MRLHNHVYIDFKKRALDCADAGDRDDVIIDWVFCGPSYAYSYMTSPAGGLRGGESLRGEVSSRQR
jgi:hypothetical protein